MTRNGDYDVFSIWMFVFLFVSSPLLSTVSAQELDLLMVGNSYIYNNEMQNMVKEMLEEGLGLEEHDVYARRRTSGGATWLSHLESGSLEPLIQQRRWTWVVLQEQSQTPGLYDIPSYPNFDESVAALIAIDEMVRAVGSETILLMTWGRRNGDSQLSWLYPNFSAMQNRITQGYYIYHDTISSQDRSVRIAPVGLAFQAIHDALVLPTIGRNDFTKLYAGDGSHLDVPGTYVATCVIYATLTGHDPVGVQWMPEGEKIDEAYRDRLQAVASLTVSEFYQISLIPHETISSKPPSSSPTLARPSIDVTSTSPTNTPTLSPTDPPTMQPTRNPVIAPESTERPSLTPHDFLNSSFPSTAPDGSLGDGSAIDILQNGSFENGDEAWVWTGTSSRVCGSVVSAYDGYCVWTFGPPRTVRDPIDWTRTSASGTDSKSQLTASKSILKQSLRNKCGGDTKLVELSFWTMGIQSSKSLKAFVIFFNDDDEILGVVTCRATENMNFRSYQLQGCLFEAEEDYAYIVLSFAFSSKSKEQILLDNVILRCIVEDNSHP